MQEEELEDVEAPVRGIETGTKVSVENLEYSVNEENLKVGNWEIGQNSNRFEQDVFERVGTVKKVIIRYDRSGRSEGTAEVTFARKADADSAVRKYNGVSIDGKPVRLSVIGSNLPVGGGRGVARDGRGVARGGRSVVTGVPRGGKQVGGIIVQSSVRGAPRKVRIGSALPAFRYSHPEEATGEPWGEEGVAGTNTAFRKNDTHRGKVKA